MKSKNLQRNEAAAFFARNLAHQEKLRWAEYLKRGTREALKAWRDVRHQLRRQRGLAA